MFSENKSMRRTYQSFIEYSDQIMFLKLVKQCIKLNTKYTSDEGKLINKVLKYVILTQNLHLYY